MFARNAVRSLAASPLHGSLSFSPKGAGTVTATAHRSTRDRPAKPPLSEDAVVDTALEILKTDGLGAVTMRRGATPLDPGPGPPYVYVAGRGGVLQAMLERIFASVALEDPDPARWRAQLHALLLRMRRALLAHPGIAGTAIAETPTPDD